MTIYHPDVLLFLFGTSLLFHVQLTVASWSAYRFLKRQVRWYGISLSFRNFHNLLWFTQSKALARSIKQKYMFFRNSLAFLMIQQMLAICSLVVSKPQTEPLEDSNPNLQPSWKWMEQHILCPDSGLSGSINNMTKWLSTAQHKYTYISESRSGALPKRR